MMFEYVVATSKWEGIFKDPMTTAAAIDRLVHHSIIIELNIPSYRLEHAKTNTQSLGKDSKATASDSNELPSAFGFRPSPPASSPESRVIVAEPRWRQMSLAVDREL